MFPIVYWLLLIQKLKNKVIDLSNIQFINFSLAESRLMTFEFSMENFPIILLSLTSPETISKFDLSNNVSMLAVLLLKNLIKKYWEVT